MIYRYAVVGSPKYGFAVALKKNNTNPIVLRKINLEDLPSANQIYTSVSRSPFNGNRGILAVCLKNHICISNQYAKNNGKGGIERNA